MSTKPSMNLRERKIVGLIGAAHFFSHFYFLLLPLLFPILHDVYGVGYTELGIGYAVFSIASLVCQTPIGFIVDRVGARWILMAGVAVESVVLALFGVFQTYTGYLLLMGAAGMANAVYHPCDYSILTRSVNQKRLGKAFSIHTFCGQAGSLTAPVIIIMITAGLDWPYALMICSGMGLIILGGLLFGFRGVVLPDASLVEDVVQQRKSSLKLLFSTPVLLGWLFFFGYAITSTGLYDFSVAALTEIYDSTLGQAGIIIWLFLAADGVGILLAGVWAHRWKNHEWVVANCLIAFSVCMFFITFVPMSMTALSIPIIIAGLFYGFIAPSRDVIIASMAPARDMGKVFGTVTTGFNAGGIVGPPLFGLLLDLGDPYSIFWGAGILGIITIWTVIRPSSIRLLFRPSAERS